MNPDPVKNIPDINSDDNQWIAWRESLNKFGKQQANLLFLEAWKTRSPDGNWWSSSKANTVKLRDYLESKGISLDKGVLDYSASFMDSVDNFFTSTFKVGKYAGIGITAIVVLIIIVILYSAVKNPQGTKELAMALA